MFQFGKLIVQSTVSTLGTTAIAAQAVTNTMELFGVMPGQAIGIGLVTVAGQCMGRGRPDEARRYMNYFTRISTVIMVFTGAFVSILAPCLSGFTALTEEGLRLVCHLTWFMSVTRILLWPCAFTLPNGMRAAGDVSFSMWVSTVSMWVLRVGLSWWLCRYTPVGLWGIWIGWSLDWVARVICFLWRYRSGRWAEKRVLD